MYLLKDSKCLCVISLRYSFEEGENEWKQNQRILARFQSAFVYTFFFSNRTYNDNLRIPFHISFGDLGFIHLPINAKMSRLSICLAWLSIFLCSLLCLKCFYLLSRCPQDCILPPTETSSNLFSVDIKLFFIV